jgi:hypothetical protein
VDRVLPRSARPSLETSLQMNLSSSSKAYTERDGCIQGEVLRAAASSLGRSIEGPARRPGGDGSRNPPIRVAASVADLGGWPGTRAVVSNVAEMAMGGTPVLEEEQRARCRCCRIDQE